MFGVQGGEAQRGDNFKTKAPHLKIYFWDVLWVMSSSERDKEVKSLIKVFYKMAYRSSRALFVNICLLLSTLEKKILRHLRKKTNIIFTECSKIKVTLDCRSRTEKKQRRKSRTNIIHLVDGVMKFCSGSFKKTTPGTRHGHRGVRSPRRWIWIWIVDQNLFR